MARCASRSRVLGAGATPASVQGPRGTVQGWRHVQGRQRRWRKRAGTSAACPRVSERHAAAAANPTSTFACYLRDASVIWLHVFPCGHKFLEFGKILFLPRDTGAPRQLEYFHAILRPLTRRASKRLCDPVGPPNTECAPLPLQLPASSAVFVRPCGCAKLYHCCPRQT